MNKKNELRLKLLSRQQHIPKAKRPAALVFSDYFHLFYIFSVLGCFSCSRTCKTIEVWKSEKATADNIVNKCDNSSGSIWSASGQESEEFFITSGKI